MRMFLIITLTLSLAISYFVMPVLLYGQDENLTPQEAARLELQRMLAEEAKNSGWSKDISVKLGMSRPEDVLHFDEELNRDASPSQLRNIPTKAK